MKRFHVHVSVRDLAASVRFYATMFGAEPTVLKDDYAKWSLEDPRVNFAISTGQCRESGIDHLGIEVESADALAGAAAALRDADQTVIDQPAAMCCYAQGDKAWVFDPEGTRWETFHSTGEIATYGEDTLRDVAPPEKGSACCPAPTS